MTNVVKENMTQHLSRCTFFVKRHNTAVITLQREIVHMSHVCMVGCKNYKNMGYLRIVYPISAAFK